MSRIARPSSFHPRKAAPILKRLAQGESLTRICGPGRGSGYPAVLTVYNWMNRFPDFRRAYLVARLAQAERMADEVVEIADALAGGGDDDAACAKIRIDARKWRSARLAPKAYAEELALAGEGEDERVSPFDDGTAAARIAAILEEARMRKLAAEGS